MCWHTTARLQCPAVLAIRIAKEKWKAVSVTRRKLHSKDSASKEWEKRKPTWISGRSVGPTLAFTAQRSARWRPCSPKKNLHCCPCLSNRFAITNTENEQFTLMAVSK